KRPNMASLSRITCHAVHGMTPQAREGLARELFAVHAQIFSGLEFESFRDYVVERPSFRTWIYVKHNAAGSLVGYTSMHAFHLRIAGRASTVIRLEAGTLRAARGRDLTMVYAVMRLLRLWASEPWRRFCIFAALTHPSSYTFLSHYAPVIYPHAKRDIPAGVMQRMEELASHFELERIDPENPLLRRVDWVTLESPEERTRWHTSRRADTRFYIAHNPGYESGHGLLTYIPFNGVILLRSLGRFLVCRAGRIARLVFGEQRNSATRPCAPVKPVTRPGAEWAHTRPPSL
ncbi:MAG TPA: hypothetical protein VNB23_00140, partial [Ramlibacter sp.]|nr:hypothetical protein [Ramlibacter sp.]